MIGQKLKPWRYLVSDLIDDWPGVILLAGGGGGIWDNKIRIYSKCRFGETVN